MGNWCNDCAWPVECAAEGECRRRAAGEVRRAATPDEADCLRVAVEDRAGVFSDVSETLRRAYLGRGG